VLLVYYRKQNLVSANTVSSVKSCIWHGLVYLLWILIPQLKKQTGSSVVFLVPLLRETEEAVVQVIGEKVLQQEMRFPVSLTCGSVCQRRYSSV